MSTPYVCIIEGVNTTSTEERHNVGGFVDTTDEQMVIHAPALVWDQYTRMEGSATAHRDAEPQVYGPTEECGKGNLHTSEA